ncbi:MAG TPA: hypothetical protein VGE58_03540 [Daejeonella sp.]
MPKISVLLICYPLLVCLLACGRKRQTKTTEDEQPAKFAILDSMPARHMISLKPPAPDTIPYTDMFDNIRADSIAVGNNNGNVYFTGSVESFLEAFGPAKEKRIFSEMLDEMRIFYELDGLDAEFDTAGNNRNINIKNPAFKMRLGRHWYKPGDHISMLAKQFPKSYKSRDDNRIYIIMSLHGVFLDACVAIFYDENGKITWLTSGANES